MTITFPDNGDVTAEILKLWAEAVGQEQLSTLGLLHIAQDGTAMPWLCCRVGKLPEEISVNDGTAPTPYISPILSGMEWASGGYRLQEIGFPPTEAKQLQDALEKASNILQANSPYLTMPSPFSQAIQILKIHFYWLTEIAALCDKAEKFWKSFPSSDSSVFRTVQRWKNLKQDIDMAEKYAAEQSDLDMQELLQSDLDMLRTAANNLPIPTPSEEKRDLFAKSLKKLDEFNEYGQISVTLSHGKTLKERLEGTQTLRRVFMAFDTFETSLNRVPNEIYSQEEMTIPRKEEAQLIWEELQKNFRRL